MQGTVWESLGGSKNEKQLCGSDLRSHGTNRKDKVFTGDLRSPELGIKSTTQSNFFWKTAFPTQVASLSQYLSFLNILSLLTHILTCLSHLPYFCSHHIFIQSTSICFCSVTQLCPTLCNPMDCSMPGFPVLHHLPEVAQTHVHWDAIQPSCPLSSPSPLAFSLSQYQGPPA